MPARPNFALLLALPLVFGGKSLDTDRFRIEFLQDGVPVPIADEVVRLQRKTFVIRVALLDGLEGITVNASFNRHYFDAGKDGSIPDYEHLAPKTMVEPNFNEEHALLVDSESVCYWFYDPGHSWHRFDPGIVVEEDHVLASKTIDTLAVIHQHRSVPVAEASDTLYLFFLAQSDVPTGVVPKELARARAILTWN